MTQACRAWAEARGAHLAALVPAPPLDRPASEVAAWRVCQATAMHSVQRFVELPVRTGAFHLLVVLCVIGCSLPSFVLEPNAPSKSRAPVGEALPYHYTPLLLSLSAAASG